MAVTSTAWILDSPLPILLYQNNLEAHFIHTDL